MKVAMRVLFFALLLGIWVQPVNACPETTFAPGMRHEAMEIITPPLAEPMATFGDDSRCECPAIVQDLQAVISESSKTLIAAHVEDSGAFLNSSNPNSVALAMHTRASSFIARHPGQPPYLFASRLRQ